MPTVRYFKYEFSDYDEAMAAIKTYQRSEPPNVAPWPRFEIDHISMEDDDMTIWIKLIKEN